MVCLENGTGVRKGLRRVLGKSVPNFVLGGVLYPVLYGTTDSAVAAVKGSSEVSVLHTALCTCGRGAGKFKNKIGYVQRPKASEVGEQSAVFIPGTREYDSSRRERVAQQYSTAPCRSLGVILRSCVLRAGCVGFRAVYVHHP